MGSEPLQGLVVCLDDVPLDDLIGPVEVLVQEGLSTFSLPVAATAWDQITNIYGRRARFGQHAITRASQVRTAIGQGATFLLPDAGSPDILVAALEAGVATYPPAMTPTEVRSVVNQHVAGVQLYPADVVGHVMAGRLSDIGLAQYVVPRGGLGAFAVGEWLKAGSPAACVDHILLGDALTGGDLGMLRDRVPAFLRALPA